MEGVEFNVLRAFHHELRVDALAWSPESRLDRLPIIRYWFTFCMYFSACNLTFLNVFACLL